MTFPNVKRVPGHSRPVVFIVFLLTNVLLSYGPLGSYVKILLGLAGILIPLGWLMRQESSPLPDEKPAFERESFESIPPWIYWAVGLLALIPRFFQLTELSRWLFPDDGYFSYYSSELSKAWSWHFFFTFGQEPLFFNWSLALFFKFFQPSLFTIWLFPAMLSAMTLGLYCFAFRTIFSKTFSLICFCWMGFSFWPWFNGRFCIPEAAMPFWEALTFLLLSLFITEKSPVRRPCLLRALGWAAGLGFFVARAWLVVASSVVLAVHFMDRKKPKEKGFLLPLLSSMAPPAFLFAWASLHEKNGRYFQKLWALHSGMDWAQQGSDFFAHVRAVFWGYDWSILYGPVWGGMLNPILGSFFLLGLMEGWKWRRRTAVRWVFLSFGVFFLPAVAATGFDTFRIFQILPLVIVAVVMGMFSLWDAPKTVGKITLIIILFLSSVALDCHHLFSRFHRVWGEPGTGWELRKSPELSRAYDILMKTNKDLGPGSVLADLRTHVADPSLIMAAYPFDVCRNPKFTFEDAHWVSVVTDANYRPFLAERFPAGKWYWIGEKKSVGYWMLGVIPLNEENRAGLSKWFEVNQGLRGATYAVISSSPWVSQSLILDRIYQVKDLLGDDPFLQSCFWEKVFTHRAIDHDELGCLEAIREGLQNGYPLAEFYNEEGAILVQQGKTALARAAFQKAVHSKLNLTPAAENLKALDQAGL